MKSFSSINKFFSGVREWLSKYPIIYAILGAVGIILFWRGVWHMADFVSLFFISNQSGTPLDYGNFFDSFVSILIGFILLLVTGLFVNDFIGSQIVSTAVKEEKKIEKIAEETESEEKTEEERLDELSKRFEKVTSHLDEHLENIEKKLKDK